MLPYFSEVYGNAASGQHTYGREAATSVDQAVEQVAALIGAWPQEIVFTSGATESDNLAIKGAADAQPGARARLRGQRAEAVEIATPAAKVDNVQNAPAREPAFGCGQALRCEMHSRSQAPLDQPATPTTGDCWRRRRPRGWNPPGIWTPPPGTAAPSVHASTKAGQLQ